MLAMLVSCAAVFDCGRENSRAAHIRLCGKTLDLLSERQLPIAGVCRLSLLRHLNQICGTLRF
jgi:hypothetical protein